MLIIQKNSQIDITANYKGWRDTTKENGGGRLCISSLSPKSILNTIKNTIAIVNGGLQTTSKKTTELLSEEISNRGEVSWTRILEVTDYDELIYKLTLKYLRQKGYDIGDNKIPRVK
jgi:hypothetical protein